jgi:hypothetical protein
MNIENTKKIPIHPKQAYALGHILCSFFLGRITVNIN